MRRPGRFVRSTSQAAPVPMTVQRALTAMVRRTVFHNRCAVSGLLTSETTLLTPAPCASTSRNARGRRSTSAIRVLDAINPTGRSARLPRIGIGRPQAVIGRSTVPAMQSGIYWGYVGMIEGLIARIRAEYGGPMKVVGTGGLAPLLAEGTMMIEQIDPDLTLEGLRLLAERNPAPTLSRERTRLIEQE